MKKGIFFPAPELGHDVGAIRDWASGVEEIGYDQVQIIGQTVGMDPAFHSEIHVPYTHATVFLDPFVAVGFMAAITTSVRFMTSVYVLPAHQTVDVAKQAADADFLSNGRLILGVGVGSNPIDFSVSGMNFRDRGRRIEEQIAVMRMLWTQPSVSYQGHWHDLKGVGISPKPVQGLIPIWMGGNADAVISRVGRLADGFVRGGGTPPDKRAERFAAVKQAVRDAGRQDESFPIADTLMVTPRSAPEDWRGMAEAARNLGVTHLSVATLRLGFTTADQHLRMAADVKAAIDGV